MGGFDCTCEPGYVLTEGVCVDVDECAEGLDNCGTNESCSNTDGGFECACATGFSEGEEGCVLTDPCADGGAGCGEVEPTEGSGGCGACHTGGRRAPAVPAGPLLVLLLIGLSIGWLRRRHPNPVR